MKYTDPVLNPRVHPGLSGAGRSDMTEEDKKKEDKKSDQYEGDLSEILSPGIRKPVPPRTEYVSHLSEEPAERKPSFAYRILEILVKIAAILGVLALFAYYAMYAKIGRQ